MSGYEGPVHRVELDAEGLSESVLPWLRRLRVRSFGPKTPNSGGVVNGVRSRPECRMSDESDTRLLEYANLSPNSAKYEPGYGLTV